jgi:hypothetical protein
MTFVATAIAKKVEPLFHSRKFKVHQELPPTRQLPAEQ